MKELVFVFIPLLVLGCARTDSCTPLSLEGTSTAVINNVNWTGVTEALRTNPLTILGSNLNDPLCFLDEGYSLQIPAKDGSFPFSTQVDTILQTAEIIYKIYDYDSPLAKYGLTPGNENGSITISFDTITERFSGYFNITLYLVQNFDGALHPDSLVMENAEFETGYKN